MVQAIIELGISLGVVLDPIGATQDLGGLLRIVTDRPADKDGADVGTGGEQLSYQIRYLVLIQTSQRLQNIEAGGFPEIIHLGWLAMLYGQPAITGQSLQHFAQGRPRHPDQLG